MPRWVYIACAWLFAGISVALAARYGYKSADTPTDGLVYGLMFGAIAAGGGIMQALAVHVVTGASMARGYRVMWGIIIGAIGLGAMLATVLSSLGAIAGRADATAADRTNAADNIKDVRATLKRFTAEREGLKFVATSELAVEAVKAAVASAERSRAAECGNGEPKQRGPNCRARETTEQEKRDALANVATNKALADRATKLDTDIATLRAHLAKEPAPQAANPLAAALSRMLGMSVSDAADRRDLFLAMVLELLVAGSMIGVELTRHQTTTSDLAQPANPPSQLPESVAAFFAAKLPMDTTAQTDVRTIYAAYAAWCKASSPKLAPLPTDVFGRRFGAECKRRNVVVKRSAEGQLCVSVRVA